MGGERCGGMSGPEVYVLGFPRSRGGTCGHLLAVRYSRASVPRDGFVELDLPFCLCVGYGNPS